VTAALLTTQLNVGPLAPNVQVTVQHGIHYGGLPRKPNIIMPDRDTPISVLAFDELTITFKNFGMLTASAEFFVELEHTIQRDVEATVEQIWKGA
jgi:hypothetical protein